METNKTGVPADLLKAAGTIPKNVATEAFDPMEQIPTIRVGKEWVAGQVIAGWFEELQELASHKFSKSQTTNAEGVPTSFRGVLRVGSPAGERLAIWCTAELKNVFSKLNAGEFVAITYKGKGKNADNNDQHFFEYKRQASN